MRARSRSGSRSPGGYRGRHRDHSRSQSPTEKQPSISERLKSRLGPRSDKQSSPVRGRLKSTQSRSPDAAPPDHRDRMGSASPSSSRPTSNSPSGQRGLVSYGDGSPDSGTS